jgi:integrase
VTLTKDAAQAAQILSIDLLDHVIIGDGRFASLKVHAHRFRHTFATWAIEQNACERDVQYLLGHSCPEMVRRYAPTYNSEQAARRHAAFSPAERLVGIALAE